MLFIWIILVIVGIAVWVILIGSGIACCSDNNAIGVVLLFIALNIIGLLIGLAILHNAHQKQKQEQQKTKVENMQKITHQLADEIKQELVQAVAQELKKEV